MVSQKAIWADQAKALTPKVRKMPSPEITISDDGKTLWRNGREFRSHDGLWAPVKTRAGYPSMFYTVDDLRTQKPVRTAKRRIAREAQKPMFIIGGSGPMVRGWDFAANATVTRVSLRAAPEMFEQAKPLDWPTAEAIADHIKAKLPNNRLSPEAQAAVDHVRKIAAEREAAKAAIDDAVVKIEAAVPLRWKDVMEAAEYRPTLRQRVRTFRALAHQRRGSCRQHWCRDRLHHPPFGGGAVMTDTLTDYLERIVTLEDRLAASEARADKLEAENARLRASIMESLKERARKGGEAA